MTPAVRPRPRATGWAGSGSPADAISIRGSEGDTGAGSGERGSGVLGQPGRPVHAGRGPPHLCRGPEPRRLSADRAGARELGGAGARRARTLRPDRHGRAWRELARERLDRLRGWRAIVCWRTRAAAYSEGAGFAEAGPAYAAVEPVSTARQGYWHGPLTSPRRAETRPSILPTTMWSRSAEEELRVGKREVGRGRVRVRSYVTERPVEEQVELRQERVTIERRPVDRAVAPGDAAFTERTIEAVERGEEAVVSKTARVTEEIGLRTDVERRPRPCATPSASRMSRSRTTGRLANPQAPAPLSRTASSTLTWPARAADR